MRFAVCEKPGIITMGEKNEPEYSPGEAIVQIHRVGVCGTDLHAFAGDQMFFRYPRILGHELSGTVLAIGSGVENVRPGDRVTVIPFQHCGSCLACRSGKTNCCSKLDVIGVHSDGGMQERIAVRSDLLIRVNQLSLQELALIEPLSIGAHAIRRARLKESEFCVVVGCGPIGLGILHQCQLAGGRSIAIDYANSRLTFAREELGIEFTINPSEQNPVEAVAEITKGDLASVVFDASGNREALQSGHQYMCHGGRYVIVGLYNGDLTFYHPAVQAKETSLLFSRNATAEDFHQVIEMLNGSSFPSPSFITSSVSFENLTSHFERWQDPSYGVIKAMIEISDP